MDDGEGITRVDTTVHRMVKALPKDLIKLMNQEIQDAANKGNRKIIFNCNTLYDRNVIPSLRLNLEEAGYRVKPVYTDRNVISHLLISWWRWND